MQPHRTSAAAAAIDTRRNMTPSLSYTIYYDTTSASTCHFRGSGMAGAELGARHVLSAAYDPDRPRPLRGAARGRAGPPRLSRRRREHGERTVIMSPGPENHSLAENLPS